MTPIVRNTASFALWRKPKLFAVFTVATTLLISICQTRASEASATLKWPGVSGDVRIIRQFSHDAPVSAMAWSADGRQLATLSGFFRQVTVWNADTGAKTFELRLAFPFSNVLAFTPDGRYLLTGPDKEASRPGYTAATLWDMKTGEVAREIDGPFPEKLPVENLVRKFVFSHDGKRAALIAQQAPRVPFALYETENWTVIATVPVPEDIPHTLAFSPDDRSLAIGTVGGKVIIFDAARRIRLKAIDAYENDGSIVGALCYSPDGGLIATGAGLSGSMKQADGTWKNATPPDPIRIWNASTGLLVRSYPASLENVSALACNPDGRNLASASGDFTVRLWGLLSAQDGRTLLNFSSPPMALAFGPGGKQLAVIGDNLAFITELGR